MNSRIGSAVPAAVRRGATRATLLVAAGAAAAALTSCTRASEEARETPAGETPAAEAAAPEPVLSPAAQTALDSGNAAYRAGRYDEAMKRYNEVVAAAPEHPVAHFGIYMAAMALGDSARAESALVRVRETAPDGSLLLHAGPAGPHGAPTEAPRVH
ncbi:MAG: tetratricopeptide repeat protein [Gemmatimonadetes bacterium]|nr:tetratricopeptide repeat protein [Gemmatimonadota bacterium]